MDSACFARAASAIAQAVRSGVFPMFRSLLLATSALCAATVITTQSFAQADFNTIETVTVTAKKLDDARSGIQTQTGASTYTITAEDIDASPGGANNLLNQVALQAPSVAQDSFGQFHVRGEHNALQYRLNGVIIP